MTTTLLALALAAAPLIDDSALSCVLEGEHVELTVRAGEPVAVVGGETALVVSRQTARGLSALITLPRADLLLTVKSGASPWSARLTRHGDRTVTTEGSCVRTPDASEPPKLRGRVKTLRPRLSGEGKLETQEVQRVMRAHLGELQYCYEKQLRRDPTLHGKIVVRWTVDERGRVVDAKDRGSTVKSPDAIQCVLSKIRRWRHPKPRGGFVIVDHAFIFNTL
jgi:hypothetical protein